MKNFVFISPNFPSNYYHFCRELKNNGLRVLGIGDSSYEMLRPELKASLDEYYKVDSLENYDSVFKAVAFFSFKYGKIDYLESNNEYWLEQDAMLRDDFNINTSFHYDDMKYVKFKSKMKEKYALAGIPCARYYLVETYEGCLDFINWVGYPVIAKPDNGVGACGTYKINNETDLKNFMDTKGDALYIMEEYIDGTIVSYDAIVDSHGDPLFETGNVTTFSLLEVVNNLSDSAFFIRKELPDVVREKGRAVVRTFGVKSRFVHFEFFCLNKDQYLGKKDDIVALEVNMRPSGGVSPVMMNYANGADVYKIWADMIAFDKLTHEYDSPHHYCAFVGRRDGLKHKFTIDALRKKYPGKIVLEERVEKALSGAMGDYMFLATLDSEEELNKYLSDALKLV